MQWPSVSPPASKTNIVSFLKSELDAIGGGSLAPFQGASLWGGWSLGLKPQAESWSPCGGARSVFSHRLPQLYVIAFKANAQESG
jgi:hypothetical protein